MAQQIRELQQQVAQLESTLATERSDEDQPMIAEESEKPADAEREDLPRTKAIQRMRVQGEMIGVRRLPEPLPIEIVLAQDTPEKSKKKIH
jgi:hypothetical protein